ncbi:hypothetical protein F4810DRAFT_259925 [Camillea tinctor]|nr:hypothetical protein F4810DRAFT_259925 [Camillea tinctor]
MGFWDGLDSASVISRKSSRSHRSSHKSKKSRSRSPTRHHSKHHHRTSSGLDSIWEAESRASSPRESVAGSFFNLGNGSSRSFFSTGRSNSSFYRRSPRSSFLQRTYKKLKRLLRDLIYYAKRHPLKVFMLVVMPLITGGALTALLARFGLRLPPGVERMLGIAARTASGDSIGLVGEAMRLVGGSGSGGIRVERGQNDGYQWERRTEYRDGGEGWGSGSGSGGGGFWEELNKFFS